MSQPVELADELVRDAQLNGRFADRSVADQIEYWVGLGRAVEPFLNGSKTGAPGERAAAPSLSQCFAAINTAEGLEQLAEYLVSTPFPHYEVVPGNGELLLRIEADGKRTMGRFEGREFRPVE